MGEDTLARIDLLAIRMAEENAGFSNGDVTAGVDVARAEVDEQ